MYTANLLFYAYIGHLRKRGFNAYIIYCLQMNIETANFRKDNVTSRYNHILDNYR